MHAGQGEVQKVAVHLVGVVDDQGQGKRDLAAVAPHRQLAAVGLGQRLEAAVPVAEPLERVVHLPAAGRRREHGGEPHAGYERREHISGLAADGEVLADGHQALSGQDAVPGAPAARRKPGWVAARVVSGLVDDAAVLRVVDVHELPLARREAGGARQLEGVLVAAERHIEGEVLQLAYVAELRVVDD